MSFRKLFASLGLGTAEAANAATATTTTTTNPDEVTKDNLFPLVTPAEAECLKDCSSCMAEFPRSFSINEKDALWGKVKPYSVHVVVATGKKDWKREVVDEKGSVMEALGKGKGKGTEEKEKGKEGNENDRKKKGMERLMISASNMRPPEEYYNLTENQPTTVLLLPSFQMVHNVTPQDVPELLERIILPGPKTWAPEKHAEATTNGDTPAEADVNGTVTRPPTNAPPKLTPVSSPYSTVILLCSHSRRDARCGIAAPLLAREFERHLRPLGLFRDLNDTRPNGVGIFFISHIGGHKYAGNVLIYRRDGAMGVWLARVKPNDVEGIVKHTVLEGRIVDREMVRGGFCEGKVSW